MGDLFTYRLRMIYGKWNLIYDGLYHEYNSYQRAIEAAKELKLKGYVDGDTERAYS